jgi:hypothetical protein
LPPLLQMYFSLRMEEGWQSQVNKGSQLPQLHQLHQSSGLNRDNIHLSIYIRGSTLPTSLLSFQNRGCSGASHQPDPHLLPVNHHFLAHSSFFSPAVDALALFALSRSQKPANVSFSNSAHVFTGITFSFSSSILFRTLSSLACLWLIDLQCLRALHPISTASVAKGLCCRAQSPVSAHLTA